MLDSKLVTFVCVAETGSFSKAAKETFTTPTAINKQISSLEKNLGIKLFQRTYRGLTLTRAGHSLYMDAKHIIQYYNDSIARAKKVAFEGEGIIKIGSSPMTPVRMLYRVYSKICETNPDIKIQIINFVNTKDTVDKIFAMLGNEMDVICTNLDERMLSSYDCCTTELARLPFQCAMSFHHRLSRKERLDISDLYGENLLILKEGRSKSVDRIRCDLQRDYPQIHLFDFDVFDTSVFNLCETADYVALAIPGWENMYPMLKIVPVDWNYSTSFGLLHSPNPTDQVQRFLDAAIAVSHDL